MSGRRRKTIDDDDDGEEPDRVMETQLEQPDENGGPSQSQAADSQRPRKKKKHDDDGYQEGAVVRVRMHNFLTYDDAEVHPGPRLNMLIGPNGTGKSSLVAAIIIGVGGKATITGRFNELKEMVKKDKDRGYVEIELKKKSGNNVVIKREWKKDSNNSTWKLNGESVSEKEILAAVKKLHIQVDNLCQVLPQDRVAEFAGLNPQQLLKETQRAAGGETMVQVHEKLVELNKEVKDIEKDIETLQKSADADETQNRRIEDDVKRLQDLDKIKDDLKLVKAKIAIKRYNAAYDYVQGLRKEEKELKRRKRELEDANAPLVEERKRLEAEVKDLQGAAKQAGDKYNEVGRKNTEYVNRLDASEKDVEDKRVSLKRIKENEKKIQKKIEEEANELEKAKRFLTQTKKELEDAGVPVDDNDLPSGRYAEVIAELNNISRQLRELEDRRNEIDANSQPFKTQSRDLIHERDRVLQELERLDSATEQRRARLRAKDPDTGKAMDWIRNNGGTSNNGQNALQAAPFDPILVEMNLKESRFASIVEAMVPFRLLKVIGAKTSDDFHRLTNELMDQRRLRISIAEINPADRTDRYRKPISDNELHSLGFEGWIIDLFDAPEPVKAYLCKEGSLHLLPYSTRPLSKAQRERIEAHRVNGQPTFQRFVTGDVVYQIKALGNETLARSDSVGDPQYLTGGADSTRKDQLEHRRGEITRQQREVEASLAEFRKQEGVVAQKMKPLEDQKKPLLAERDHLKSLRSKIGAAQDKIKIKQNAIERLRMSIASNQAEHEEASKAIVKLVDKRINTIRELAKNSDELVKVHLRKYTLMNLRQLKLQAEAKAAADAVSAASAELEEVDRLYQEKKEEHLKAKDLAKAAAEEVEETKRELTDEQMATIVVGLSDISFEQLEQDESTLTAQIENGSKLDRGIITEYNNRKQMLEQKKETIAEKKRDLEAKNSTMNELREQWYPKVTELVRKIDEEFSKHFKRISCVGEVQLSEEGTYDQWGILILVKFRATENLQQLTFQRQSGGERAVSTISYLMALQTLINVPFRIVDEINQGMDPRNERLVHGAFVKVSCEDDTSQYFLVTPKVLPDLRYHRKMRVLVVMNGDYLPKEEVDLCQVLATKRALVAAAS